MTGLQGDCVGLIMSDRLSAKRKREGCVMILWALTQQPTKACRVWGRLCLGTKCFRNPPLKVLKLPLKGFIFKSTLNSVEHLKITLIHDLLVRGNGCSEPFAWQCMFSLPLFNKQYSGQMLGPGLLLPGLTALTDLNNPRRWKITSGLVTVTAGLKALWHHHIP